jgi:hypothetical protein
LIAPFNDAKTSMAKLIHEFKNIRDETPDDEFV